MTTVKLKALATTVKLKAIATPKRERKVTIPVSESNINKAAIRLLDAKLVCTEIQYVQRELGNSATQEDVDAKVIAVRGLPWASIIQAE
jgi:hypothetical protein